MRPDKRSRQAALLADPKALALWVEQRRARELQAVVKSNEGAKPERHTWRKDLSFDRDYVMGKTHVNPREMRATMGQASKSPTCKRWAAK